MSKLSQRAERTVQLGPALEISCFFPMHFHLHCSELCIIQAEFTRVKKSLNTFYYYKNELSEHIYIGFILITRFIVVFLKDLDYCVYNKQKLDLFLSDNFNCLLITTLMFAVVFNYSVKGSIWKMPLLIFQALWIQSRTEQQRSLDQVVHRKQYPRMMLFPQQMDILQTYTATMSLLISWTCQEKTHKKPERKWNYGTQDPDQYQNQSEEAGEVEGAYVKSNPDNCTEYTMAKNDHIEDASKLYMKGYMQNKSSWQNFELYLKRKTILPQQSTSRVGY